MFQDLLWVYGMAWMSVSSSAEAGCLKMLCWLNFFFFLQCRICSGGISCILCMELFYTRDIVFLTCSHVCGCIRSLGTCSAVAAAA